MLAAPMARCQLLPPGAPCGAPGRAPVMFIAGVVVAAVVAAGGGGGGRQPVVAVAVVAERWMPVMVVAAVGRCGASATFVAAIDGFRRCLASEAGLS